MTRSDVVKEVNRLQQLDGWPRWSLEAQAELYDAASDLAQTIEHLHSVISSITQSSSMCPQPVHLRSALRATITKPDDQGYQPCSEGLCDGHGWRRGFALHTMMTTPGGGSYTRNQWLTEDAYKDLVKKVDWKSQCVYEGVTRCKCRSPKGVQSEKTQLQVVKK